MIPFIAALILAIVAVVGLVTGGAGRIVAVTAGFLAILALIFSISTIVPTKQVGIPVTFGRPGTPIGNGFHFKTPWTKVVIMDATIQDVDNAEDGDPETQDGPTVVKDTDDSDVIVHNLVRWSIKEDAADSLYRDYKDFERVEHSLVRPEIKTAIATVMADYDPLGENQPTYDQLASEVRDRLQKRVGDRIVVHSVGISLVDFSDTTKNRINALNAERANTRIAEQRTQTADKEAQANKALADSISRDPNVVVANCMKTVAEAEPGTFPAGFQCWPGGGGSVVVPAGR